MKKTLVLLVTLFIAYSTFAQQKDTKEKKYGIEFSGFVNLQAFYDTRQMVEAREGMFTLYPKNAEYDLNGIDINDEPGLQMLAMTTRLTGNISGPNALGAKTSAVIEGDFTGVSNSDNNGFRLRHAYIKLDWGHDDLLLGHYWHPLDVPDVKVGSIALNTGAPFHSFSRFNQISYRYRLKKLETILFAGMERDYASTGNAGTSSIYQRNAGLPNFHMQLRYKSNRFLAGVGGDIKWLRPKLVTDAGYATDEMLTSTAMVAYVQYKFDNYNLKVQAVDGQNLTDHLMLGGYAEYITDTLTGMATYHNIRQQSAWMVFEKSQGKLRPGIFAGYAQNLGSDHEINGGVYARGADIAYVYRIGPRISYFSGKLMLALEVEYTTVAYGTPDKYLEVQDAKEYSNLRTLFGAFYFF